MKGWRVEHERPGWGIIVLSDPSPTREGAMDRACKLGKRFPVFRVVGPNGEVIDLPEIEQHCRDRAA